MRSIRLNLFPFLIFLWVSVLPSSQYSIKDHEVQLISPRSNFKEPLTRADIRELERKRAHLNMPKVPSIWTQDFGDCMANSSIHINRFEAAYHAHNLTVSFSWEGTTQIQEQYIMIYLAVIAYGEARFEILFDPCKSNLKTLCPTGWRRPIQATHEIPLAEEDVRGIPDIALSIPDFEGRALFRVFSNFTRNQIGCVSADLTNGKTFSHPRVIAPIMAALVLAAVVVSLGMLLFNWWKVKNETEPPFPYSATPSAGFILSVLQSIYLTGALSLSFPSNLVAFWSNFAWTCGIIYNESMQKEISKWMARLRGGQDEPIELGYNDHVVKMLYSLYAPNELVKRDDNSYYGEAIKTGIPIPGTYYGFPATLAATNIPTANAFLTSFFFICCLNVGFLVTIPLCRFVIWLHGSEKLNGLIRWSQMRRRMIWLGSWFRLCIIGFFPTLTMAFFETTLPTYHKIWSSIILFFTMLLAIALIEHVLWREHEEEKKWFEWHGINVCLDKTCPRRFPWWKITFGRGDPAHGARILLQIPIMNCYHEGRRPTHLSQTAHGLIARYRGDRTWAFFVPLFVYLVVKAAFYGGIKNAGIVQVAFLFIWELVYLALQLAVKPYGTESLHLVRVQAFGAMKILTLALMLPLAPKFNINRIIATALGIFVIIIQGSMIILVIIHTLLTFLLFLQHFVAQHFASPSPQKQQQQEGQAEGALAQLQLAISSRLVIWLRKLEVLTRWVYLPELPPAYYIRRIKAARARDEAFRNKQELSFEMRDIRRYPKIEDIVAIENKEQKQMTSDRNVDAPIDSDDDARR